MFPLRAVSADPLQISGFWLRPVKLVGDCQSGFRAYPVQYLNRLGFKGSQYDFEAEVLAKAAWAGLALKTVDIDVIYPKPAERVSSFKPFLDNLRLTRIHSMLVGRRLLPIPHKKLVENRNNLDVSLLRHPGKVLQMLLKESATPEGLGAFGSGRHVHCRSSDSVHAFSRDFLFCSAP